jgi:hypothetical protein
MIPYDNTKPLVYIHLFKTAGISIRQYFENKLRILNGSERFISEYPWLNSCTSENIQNLKEKGISNPIFYGHFDDEIENRFPVECNQFMTTLRDPFDMQVSYFYYSVNRGFVLPENVYTIEKYIQNSSFNFRFSNVFNKEILTMENFKEVLNKYFVFISTIDYIEVFNKILDFYFQKKESNTLDLTKISILKNNVRDQSKSFYSPDHLREMHREKWPLDYAIYDYINNYYGYC